MRQANSDQLCLKLAEQARSESDLDTAVRLYIRVARSPLAGTAAQEARRQIESLQAETREQWAAAEKQLETAARQSASETSDQAIQASVQTAFGNLETLAEKYERVPQSGREVQARLSQLKRQPQYAMMLNEPRAMELWQIGQKHEQEGQLCCAYLVYQEATQLMPAPSASLAKQRFERMSEDKAIVASAQTCQDLQWCHSTFRTAQRVAEVKPEAATDLFQQIIRRSPADSAVHRAAEQEAARLAQKSDS
jgi:hypothetical protein